MAVKASAAITVAVVAAVSGVTRYYCLQVSTATPPSSASTGWPTVEPAFSDSSTNTLYFADLTSFSDGSTQWSAVSVSSAYEAAKAAYNQAVASGQSAAGALSAAQAAQASFDNLAIGGRNLLPGTRDFTASAWAKNSATAVTVPEPGLLHLQPFTTSGGSNTSGIVKYKLSELDYKDYASGQYVLSFEARELDGEEGYTDGGMYVYLGFSLPSRIGNTFSSGYDRYIRKTVSPFTHGWKRFFLSFTLPDDLASGTEDALAEGSVLTIGFYRLHPRTPIEIRLMKLERGNLGSEWTPAPEDLESGIAEAQDGVSGLQSYADAIQAAVRAETEARLRVEEDMVTSYVTKQYYSEHSVSAEEFSSVRQTQESLSYTVGQQAEKLGSYERRVKIDVSGVDISASDTGYHTRITETGMSILDNDQEKASFHADGMYIPQARVTDVLSIGRSDYGWYDILMAGGGIGWKWRDAPLTTAAGSAVTLTDAVPDRIIKAQVAITPTQEGTGYPTTSNIRDIASWTQASVLVGAEQNAGTAQAYLFAFPSGVPVSGGSLAVDRKGRATLTVTHVAAKVADDPGLSKSGTAAGRFLFHISNVYDFGHADTARKSELMCSHLRTYTSLSTSGQRAVINSSIQIIVQSGNADHSTVEAFRAWLDELEEAGHPLMISWPLATPVTYRLTGARIMTIAGTNVIWSPQGMMTVDYIAQ